MPIAMKLFLIFVIFKYVGNIMNIGDERELTGSENERRKGYKREERNVWRERLR